MQVLSINIAYSATIKHPKPLRRQNPRRDPISWSPDRGPIFPDVRQDFLDRTREGAPCPHAGATHYTTSALARARPGMTCRAGGLARFFPETAAAARSDPS